MRALVFIWFGRKGSAFKILPLQLVGLFPQLMVALADALEPYFSNFDSMSNMSINFEPFGTTTHVHLRCKFFEDLWRLQWSHENVYYLRSKCWKTVQTRNFGAKIHIQKRTQCAKRLLWVCGVAKTWPGFFGVQNILFSFDQFSLISSRFKLTRKIHKMVWVLVESCWQSWDFHREIWLKSAFTSTKADLNRASICCSSDRFNSQANFIQWSENVPTSFTWMIRGNRINGKLFFASATLLDWKGCISILDRRFVDLDSKHKSLRH